MPTRDLLTLQTTVARQLTTNERRALRELVRNYADALDSIRAQLSRVYERYSVNGVLTNAEMSRYNRLAALEKSIIDELRPVVAQQNRLIELATEVQYDEAFYRYAWSYDQAVGVPLRWGTLDAAQVRAAVDNPLRHLATRDLGAATVTRIRRSIAQGIIRGASMPAMMRDVRGAMGTTAADAMRIVRTEAHRARELGGWQTAQDATSQGVQIKRRWSASLDTKTRDSHASIDGEEVGPEERFSNGLMYPGDPAGSAAEVINCRCSVDDIIEGLEPELRRTRDRGVEPYQTFTQWANDRGVRASRYGQRYNFVRR